MRRITLLFVVIVGFVALAGCAQPTVQPTVQPSSTPTAQPSSAATPTVQAATSQATPVPAIVPFPGNYTHSLESGASLDLFGRLHDDKYYRAFNIYHCEA